MKASLSSLVLLLAAPALAWGQDLRTVPTPYPYSEPAWSPYLVGALIGTLVILTLALAQKTVGASSAYADMAGMLGRLVAPRHIASMKYFQEHKPAVNWSLLFLVGTIAGAFLAAWFGQELNGRYLQDLWVARFGTDSGALRTLLALVGGGVMAYGARVAGGCTSGHGISGTLQLAVGSWISVICFFVGGIGSAMLLYRL